MHAPAGGPVPVWLTPEASSKVKDAEQKRPQGHLPASSGITMVPQERAHCSVWKWRIQEQTPLAPPGALLAPAMMVMCTEGQFLESPSMAVEEVLGTSSMVHLAGLSEGLGPGQGGRAAGPVDDRLPCCTIAQQHG